MLCAHIWAVDGRPDTNIFGTWDAWDDRLGILIPFDREKQDYINYSTSRLFAAVYPEAVALASLIASPYWRRLAGGSEAEQARFVAEVASRVTYPYSPPGRSVDAIAHWALTDSWRRPSRPLSTYTTWPRPRHPPWRRGEPSRPAREKRNVVQPAPPDQGRTLLFHGHLKPVLAREWTPRYERWVGNLWHRARIDDLMQSWY
jgi:hypothetical protein